MPLRKYTSDAFRHHLLQIWAAVFTVLVFYALHEVRDVGRENRVLAIQGKQAHDALCIEKFSKQRRYNDNEAILREVKTGPIFGIPRDIVVRSQANLNVDLKALKFLECIPPPKPKKGS